MKYFRSASDRMHVFYFNEYEYTVEIVDFLSHTTHAKAFYDMYNKQQFDNYV